MVNFNLEKTVFLNFTLKKKLCLNPKIEFNHIIVKQVSEHKHLGIIFSEDMKWTKHVAHITAKANQRIGALYRQSNKLTRRQIETMYLSAIRPILEYGSVLFDNCSIHDSKLIESAQRRAAVLSTGAIRRTETSKLFAETGWDSLKIRRMRAKMMCFYQIAKGTSPFYLKEKISFKPLQIRSSRAQSRHNAQIIEQKFHLTCFKQSFFPDCIRMWNSLSSEITNSTSIGSFKSHLLALPAFAPNKHFLDAEQYNIALKGHNGRLITQFRWGLSPLHNELFTYNIIDNPFCPSCGNCIETLSHFLFECSLYAPQRNILMSDLATLSARFNDCPNVFIDLNRLDQVAKLLLCGLNLPELEECAYFNSLLFNIVSNFISTTSRFTQHF
jgi:hypothetical protein